MSKRSNWVKEWAEAAGIVAVFTGAFAFGLLLRFRWFALAVAALIILAVSL